MKEDMPYKLFIVLLALLFITLKLCNVITWSWWWVTLPLWGPVAFSFIFVSFAFLYYLFKKVKK